MQKQNLVILGSTGSIGHSTLSVIEHNPDKYHAFALVGGKNVETMFEQCVKFQPHFAPPQKNLDIYEVRIIIQFRYN